MLLLTSTQQGAIGCKAAACHSMHTASLVGKSVCAEQRTYQMDPTCHVPAMQDYCSLSLREDHANRLCIVPIITEVISISHQTRG